MIFSNAQYDFSGISNDTTVLPRLRLHLRSRLRGEVKLQTRQES